jgi:predicted ATP-grasp superfamily ATP-dependent carboligase
MVNEAAAAIPAIVVGRAQTGLGTLRSLRLAGIPAYVACPRGDLATRSRWYRPTPGPVRWNGELGQEAQAALTAMPLQRAVLIPGSDDAALWASDIPQGPLADRFPVSGSSRSTFQILQDKSRFGEVLAGTGVPHPRTFTIRSSADIASIPFDDLDRVFVKPADSQKFMRTLGVKGLWAHDREEFEAIWQRLEAQQLAVIAQEYVPGTADQHYFIDGFRDRDGQFTGLFARRRMRISPPDFGSSSYCVGIPLREVDPALPGLIELLTRLEYRGIFSAEFKRDARDGAFRILEVNTRAWWYVEFAARCGVNVVEMAYRDALGQEVPRAPVDYVTGAGCVNLSNDLRIVLGRRRGSGTTLRTALRQWRRAHFSVFRRDDPLPGLVAAWRMAALWVRNRVRPSRRGA